MSATSAKLEQTASNETRSDEEDETRNGNDRRAILKSVRFSKFGTVQSPHENFWSSSKTSDSRGNY